MAGGRGDGVVIRCLLLLRSLSFSTFSHPAGRCYTHLHRMSSYWERLVQARLSKELFIGVALGFSLCLSSTSLWLYFERGRRKSRPHVDFDNFTPIEIVRNEVAKGVSGLVGRCRVALLPATGLTDG